MAAPRPALHARRAEELRSAKRIALFDRVDLGALQATAQLKRLVLRNRSGRSVFARLTTYREAQASAMAAKRGIWRSCGG